MGSVQPVFDIVGAAAASVVVASTLIRNFQTLIPQCFREDVNPLVICALERLGAWLMVDSDRLRQAEDAFARIPPPKVWTLRSLSLVVGLHVDPRDSLVRTIGRNQCLIAAFLCLGACTTCFRSIHEASDLMHELMKLDGILKDYKIPANLVHQFASAVNGCQQYIQGETAAAVYERIAGAVLRETTRNGLRFDNLNFIGNTEKLAEIIYEVIEKLQNQEFQYVCLSGTLHGSWLASFFVWLRPKEVQVQVRGVPIYSPMDNNANGDDRNKYNARLIIRLEEIGPKPHPNSQWHITTWTATEGIPVQINLRDGNSTMDWLEKEHPSPLPCARLQIANKFSEEVVNAIGHLAAAFIIVSTEDGCLCNQEKTISRPFGDICSDEFLGTYNNIVGEFGWQGRIDISRRGRMVDTLRSARYKLRSSTWTSSGSDSLSDLERLVEESCREYSKAQDEQMLLPSAAGSDLEESIIEHAVYIAGEALLFAFYARRDGLMRYRPLEPFRLNEHAKLVTTLVFSDPTNPEKGYSFWDLRKLAIGALLPSAPDINSTDLVIASDGYVVYSASLSHWNDELTRRRTIASLHVTPGPLKSHEVEGTLSCVTEDLQNMTLASRILDVEDRIIKLYEDGQPCLSERDAVDRGGARIMHSWRIENVSKTIHIATFLQFENSNSAIKLIGSAGEINVPTSWRRSLDAVVFANHIESADSTPKQLMALAETWKNRGLLGDRLRWCLIGSAFGDRVCYVAKTSGNEQLRFLEAGNLTEIGPQTRRLYIRHNSTPIIYCIKEIITELQGNSDWTLIS